MSKFFINRPIVAMVIAILMVIVGGVAIFSLPTAQFPNIADPQIQVQATYPGADALTVDKAVATPIEQKMSGVDNMEYMYSLNQNSGLGNLTVNFNIKTDPNTDVILTQMRESQAVSQLPPEVNAQGVVVQKSTAAPLMLFDLYSQEGKYDAQFRANYAYINFVDNFSRSYGIASVSGFGAGQYAMRIWVDPDQLAKLHITVPDIVDAIKEQNIVNPYGQVGGAHQCTSIPKMGKCYETTQFSDFLGISPLFSQPNRLIAFVIKKSVSLVSPVSTVSFRSAYNRAWEMSGRQSG
jgi:hydrophobic/amphiphilic exporter-1 (mainly G- bacteria), HAE1 family